jgi:hypothetical protein
LPLAQKYFVLQTFLQVPLLTTQLPKITREGLQEAECLEEEAKVASFLWFSAFPLELSLFSRSKTAVMAAWKPWGLACSAASIKLSQAAFRLLYLSDSSEEEKRLSSDTEFELEHEESNEGEDLTAYQHFQAHAAFAFVTATGGDVPQIMF